MSEALRILLVGGGGREHALAWHLARSERCAALFVAPGNAGTAREPGVLNVDVGADPEQLLEFAHAENVDLTIVGPEAPLVDGIVDRFAAAGRLCFGPDAAAAQLEGSKAFTKAFLERHGIPTARWQAFDDPNAARDYVLRHGAPIVVKADGLAAGKGVTVAATVDEALAAIDAAMTGDAFGAAGRRVVIEECLIGEEASFIAVCDGETILPFASSQDHKRIGEGDTGPNTGGMGAISPAPVITPEVHDRIMREVMEPTVRGMAADGHPYRGFLYAGLMIDAAGEPRVIEFNCRFGDPEAQAVLMRLRSDLVELCLRTCAGDLHGLELLWDQRSAVGVVMAAAGYPGSSPRGDAIDGFPEPREDLLVFHAGTRVDESGAIVTNGGRVLCVSALGADLREAAAIAYRAADGIRFAGAQYRRDIGHHALARLDV